MREVVNRWLSSVVALAGTVAVVMAFLAVFGQDSDRAPGAAATRSGTSSSPASPLGSPSGSPAGTATARPRAAVKQPVVVLNQAGVRGLATRTGQVLRRGGWQVSRIGDFTGTVASNTVYYPPGMADAAKALVAAFPQISSRARAAFGGLATDRLTLVLASDWAP